jgi:hypothetical protein
MRADDHRRLVLSHSHLVRRTWSATPALTGTLYQSDKKVYRGAKRSVGSIFAIFFACQ